MREPEFLPDWYHLRLQRSRRRRAFIRTSVALCLVAATGIAVSPERAPAVAVAGNVSAETSETAPRPRHKFPAGAPHAFHALHQVTPGGIVVSSLSFGDEDGVTAVELYCAADNETVAAHFESGLRRSPYFRDIEVTRSLMAASPAASAGAQSSPAIGEPVTLHVRLTVVPAEAR